jgi:hypothetical protein
MKLYEVNRDTLVYVYSLDKSLYFRNIDGLYSFCQDHDGYVYHISAITNVRVLRPMKEDEIIELNAITYQEFVY